MIVRRLARPLLAAIFVKAGVDTLRHPDTKVLTAAPFLERNVAKVRDRLPERVPTDPATLVRLDAAVKLGAGLALATGRFPRLAALVLAADLVPTTLAGHAYWQHEDPVARATHRTHFMKNLAIIGGLLIAAADRPHQRGR